MSWNVHGLGSFVKRAIIKSSLCSIKGDFILIQETKREMVDNLTIRPVKPFAVTEI